MVFGDVITFVSYVRQWFPIKIDNVEKETAIGGGKKKGTKLVLKLILCIDTFFIRLKSFSNSFNIPFNLKKYISNIIHFLWNLNLHGTNNFFPSYYTYVQKSNSNLI